MTEIGHILTYVLLFCAFYFEVFLLVSFLERRLFAKSVPASLSAAPETLPKTALVVPCFNEAENVARSIESLLALSYDKEKLEILVVDDGSTDNTYEKALAYESDPRVRVLRKERGGKHSALNYALAQTNAELIGCLDADSTVDSEALLRIVRVFKNPRVAAVTPGIHVHAPRTLMQHLQYVEYLLSIFNRYVFAGLGSLFITPGPFSIFRASTVREIGGWRHGHATEDMELGMRLQNAGWMVANEPKAEVRTNAPKTLRALVRQRVRWSYGFVRNTFDYRHMVGNPKYGNLGLIILPAAIIAIVTALYFAGRILWHLADLFTQAFFQITLGASSLHAGFFFVNTSALWLTVYGALLLLVVLITLGSFVSRGVYRLPASTPIFLVLYSLIVPMWLSIALVRALFNTGVRWR